MFRQLLTIDFIRLCISMPRYIWRVVLLNKVMVYGAVTGGVSKNTISHNIKGMRDAAVNRSHLLLRPLVSIDQVKLNLENCKLLTIGARSEGELFNMWGYGFRKKNITAVDLISYSPFIELGDMHDLKYPDNSFDVTLQGYVIAYSDDKAKMAAEMIRVTKPGGIIAIGCESHPMTEEQILAEFGYTPGSTDRIRELEDITRHFEGHIGHMFFSHPLSDVVRKANRYGQLMAIFEVVK